MPEAPGTMLPPPYLGPTSSELHPQGPPALHLPSSHCCPSSTISHTSFDLAFPFLQFLSSPPTPPTQHISFGAQTVLKSRVFQESWKLREGSLSSALPTCSPHFLHCIPGLPFHLSDFGIVPQVVGPVGWLDWFRITKSGTNSQPCAAAFFN